MRWRSVAVSQKNQVPRRNLRHIYVFLHIVIFAPSRGQRSARYKHQKTRTRFNRGLYFGILVRWGDIAPPPENQDWILV